MNETKFNDSQLKSLFEGFLDRAPNEKETVALKAASAEGHAAIKAYLLEHHQYRLKNSFFPHDYVMPNTKRHPIETSLGEHHVSSMFLLLLGRKPSSSETKDALEQSTSTRDLRYLLLTNAEYIQKTHKRPKIFAHDIGNIGSPQFDQAIGQIGQECERLIDPAVDFIRFIESRDWQKARLKNLKLKSKRIAGKAKQRIAIIVKKSFIGELDKQLSNDDRIVKSYPNSESFFEDSFCEETDIAIVNANYVATPELQKQWKQLLKPVKGPLGVIWNYDNHHSFTGNIVKGSIFDVFVPAHTNYTDYLMTAKCLLVSPTPCGLAQWTPDFVREGFEKFGNQERSNKLDGGFTLHNYRGAYREKFIEELSQALPNSDVRGVRFGEKGYWRNDPMENVKTWMSYKSSVSISINNDIPIRVFDALAVGQIPLVPSWLSGFDSIIPQSEQKRLPVVRYYENSAAEVARAHRQAIELFDKDGYEGALRRHNYCLEHHTLNQRYEDILGKIDQIVEAYKNWSPE